MGLLPTSQLTPPMQLLLWQLNCHNQEGVAIAVASIAAIATVAAAA